MAAIAAVASVLGSFDSSSALTLTVTVASAALPGCVLALSLPQAPWIWPHCRRGSCD